METNPESLTAWTSTITFRIRYSETDQMGTYYNSRVLEWFEVGRTEYFRAIGLPYSEIEQRGVFLPLVESHINYLSRGRYDQQLRLSCSATMAGKARIHFHCLLDNLDTNASLAEGYTVHAVVDRHNKPIRPPLWLLEALHLGENKPSALTENT